MKQLEEKTHVPKTALLVFGGLIFFVTAYVTVGPGLLCNLVGFVYPAWASFKAIETEDKEDDTQWLTYWVVYAIFNIVETFSDVILFWLPFYYSFKFGFLIWLFLPNVRGAQYLYTHVILPAFQKHEKSIDEAFSGVKDMANEEDDEDDDELSKKDK